MKSFIDLIKYPILTEKAVRLFKQNQYSFAVSKKATKPLIKAAIETLFDVKVISVNTSTQQKKTRRVGKFVGEKAQNKRAIVTLRSGDSINILETD
jgi:large subunit ribosomal protein L23